MWGVEQEAVSTQVVLLVGVRVRVRIVCCTWQLHPLQEEG
jgi:hypothetical protein